MSTFWSLWITGLTAINLALIFWVLMANRKVAVDDEADPENKTTGHVYDGIEEYDNPLPKWWFMMFIITFIFGLIYLALYPGLGNWKGLLGWTSVNQLESRQQDAREKFGPMFAKYADMPIEEVAQDPAALKMGVRLFANNCAVCHGADGSGGYGFPNLTDNDWLYGGSPATIKQTLVYGRNGNMPAWGPIIGEANVVASAEYVLKMSGNEHDEALAEKGSGVFAQNCAVCHGADGKGLHALGAPNLTDNIWLYSNGDPEELRSEIRHSIRNGRANQMPAQQDKLREDKIHLLAAYVYSLSMDDE